MFKSKKLFIAMAFSTLLIGGCSKNSSEVKEDDTNKVDEETAIEVPAQEGAEVAPLTGEAVKEEITQRPIMVTINNHQKARPQSGIEAADIIYEMLAEGDVTRLLAVYQSELPETVGPVRSARSYFIDLAKGFDAFYVAHGYSPEAKSMLSNNVVDNINGMEYDGTLFKRSKDRVAPHNSYITSENIVNGAKKVGASMSYREKVNQAFYEPDERGKIGIETSRVDINYGNSEYFHNSYLYDHQSNRYGRQSAGVDTKDMLTGDTLSIANVLFFEMKHRTIDNEGRQEIDLTSGGNAYVFQNGYMREVKWANIDGIPMAVEESGELVKLVPGKSWVHFVPTSPGLKAMVKTQP
ncbi:DUF3048 domain-containing protein [Lysinibacillus xylanilyticus]|uniref:DUF3048 domain-containing protein n=1 Tax=Lysinibacillus xylanilyticus TaxID=582475 RepID=UPI002B24DE77|nr:DUF3048 domain-containing protein [Lysinibacillus xylanilyticus]MEB2301953.1 DUF3048 domain-containing protein [Lysinibacillus xylanilyticus]